MMIRSRVMAGWRFVQGMQQRIDTANLTLVAAGGAFFAMLSIFPGLAAVITLLGFLTDPSIVQQQLPMLQEFLPQEAYVILETQITRMVTTSDSTLGWATAVTTLAALWSARKGTDALIKGINAVYGGRSRTGLWAAFLSFAMTIALSLVVIIALLAMVIVPLITTLLSNPFIAVVMPPEINALASSLVLQLLRWLIAAAVVIGGIWILYRFAPTPKRTILGPFSPGVLLAVGVWGGTSLAFSYYLSRFGNYSEVYGSIAAVVALLMFLYLTIYAVLLGAALNAELEPDPAEPAPLADPEPVTH